MQSLILAMEVRMLKLLFSILAGLLLTLFLLSCIQEGELRRDSRGRYDYNDYTKRQAREARMERGIHGAIEGPVH
jgi:hypothetical protein